MEDRGTFERAADASDAEERESSATDRRGFLRLLAGGAAAAAAAGVATRLGLDNAAAAGDEPPQWAMVIDLRLCDGCGRCSSACTLMHQLPDDQPWLRVHELTEASGQTYFLPQPCMQCERPPCVQVCPVKATYRDDDGVTLIDQSRCIGCRMCMAACPYEARTFVWDNPDVDLDIDPAEGPEPSPEFPVPQQRGTAGKCVFCVHDLRAGRLPACVRACKPGAIYIGDLVTDVATSGRRTVRLSSLLESDPFRLKEDLGTRPRVFYIPGHGQAVEPTAPA
jgi:molybdopterin-containing oxidoreductase family iron-sulfur binding subunit